ncbi:MULTISPECIES: nucleoside hydrolase [unclassified Rhizobium]|uniref:nucleoside hydrolase n=1 Tax=unclassified Rhizobium TaxID=2613769 RepID=UPI001ADB12A9|nr:MULTISPECIES: nucleoside hydrolase [unclassified Rhizobium]MBO9096732.1 nucleoside hydrolase [Rhizobium sp. L58/93]MBO9134395.1 nucleoside hydrolase [Rhizobium sp. B209b/85]MBO9166987.1 nucleoside hydrolase [Rhizobium sp. L245/93]MBO9182959.1 nucleoside hydrolase [Rhizobium sp. E27B/91]QXZ83328.1 nucleoside hydrolase [Rhizobium sp. K1/93]
MGVWIDTDMGFDDIAAILVVAHSGLEIDGVSLIMGNTPLDQVRANAASAAAFFGWRFQIHSGRAMPVLCQLETAEAILGSSGIPTLGRTLPAAERLPPGNAFAALCQWLETNQGPCRILALGPLTNIAALALARPDLAIRVTELVWMGGGVTSGNHTASAEFNAFADPEALAIVLAHGLPLRMVDLDICRKVIATPEDVDALRLVASEKATLLADLLGGYVTIGTSRGRAGMALYDPTAAAIFVAPDIADFRPARIDVELQGSHTRGRTVVETRASRGIFNAHYVAGIDAARARVIVMRALADEASR